MDLKNYRESIDVIDDKITALFTERMAIAAEIAEYKKNNGLAVRDPEREREKISAIVQKATPGMRNYMRSLFSMIFELSRAYQHKICDVQSELSKKIESALHTTQETLSDSPLVACQGVEGAYSQIACEKMFRAPNIMYFSNFESVFSAIDQGLCRYGILPLENSTAGSVNAVYDFMMKYDFSIVRSTRIKVDHCILANKGAVISDIREVFSHEQALAQCSDYIKSLGGVKITPCANTAAAAKMLSESDRKDAAAISSSSCAELYGLDCLGRSVQNQDGNYTRFICISKKLEIYPGADKTSIMVILPHKPGSLYHALSGIYALGINVIKLESRPLPNSDFEFMFYFDLATSVYSDNFKQMFDGLEDVCTKIKYLGSYMEVV